MARAALIAVITWTAAALIVVAVGRRTPYAPTGWELIGLSACALPCWAGITPGDTAFLDAPRVLADHLPAMRRLLISPSQLNLWISDRAVELSAFIHYRQARVGLIEVETAVQVGDLIARYGSPACARMDVPSGILVLYWLSLDAEGFGVWLNTTEWARVRLDLTTSSLFAGDLRGACADAERWQGFAPLSRYRDAVP